MKKIKIEVYANYTHSNNGETTTMYARWNCGWIVSRRAYNAALKRLNAYCGDYLKAANIGEEYCYCSDIIAID